MDSQAEEQFASLAWTDEQIAYLANIPSPVQPFAINALRARIEHQREENSK